jgi:Tat protein secretion system quality control protein TatD with DNase activity
MKRNDTRCHLDFFGAELDSVLQRENDAFIEAVIACGTEVADWPCTTKFRTGSPLSIIRSALIPLM